MPLLEAKAKVVVKGTADIGSVTLSLDGKDCTNGRCGFQAKKGETNPALGCWPDFRASANFASWSLARGQPSRAVPLTGRCFPLKAPEGGGYPHSGSRLSYGGNEDCRGSEAVCASGSRRLG